GTTGRKPVGFVSKPCWWNRPFGATEVSRIPWTRWWNRPSFALHLLPHFFSFTLEVLGWFGHSGGAEIFDSRHQMMQSSLIFAHFTRRRTFAVSVGTRISELSAPLLFPSTSLGATTWSLWPLSFGSCAFWA